jgi:CubicO group peptidase (beta-lactamase class C family)
VRAALDGFEKLVPETGKPQLSLEPPRRDPTIQDFLRHTSGFTYDVFGDSLVKKAYQAANVRNSNQTLAQFISRLAKLPLAYHPGTTWEYNVSTDVLGRVIEVVSGVPFDEFVSERILKPLKMTSTGFFVPESDAGRLAEPQLDPTTGRRPDLLGGLEVTRKPSFRRRQRQSGGAGMVSTAEGFARRCSIVASLTVLAFYRRTRSP